MEIKQLVAVVTVAEAGSITKAAQMLHLVQPSVTRQIKLLEEELGVALFERKRHGMLLTDAGRQLVEHAHRIIVELDRAKASLMPPSGPATGIVTLGVLDSITNIVIPPLANAVRERFPGIELRVLSAFSGHLEAWLEEGDCEISLQYCSPASSAITVTPLISETLWVLAPRSAGLEPSRAISWRDVLSRPLVLPLPGHGLRTLIDEARSQLTITPEVVVQANTMSLQQKLVHEGQGWTILPASGAWPEISSGNFSGAPLIEPDVTRQFGLARRKDRKLSAPAQVVTELATEILHNLVNEVRWPSAKFILAPKHA